MENKSTKQILLDAADIIKSRGKCIKDFEDNQGRVCMMGALHIAYNGKSGPPEIITNEYTKSWQLVMTIVGSSIFVFNDLASTTKDDASRVFKEAAQLCK